MAVEETLEEAPFTGFRCWTSSDATRVLAGEAAAASRELLLATHVAPPIRRVSVANPGTFVDLGAATQEAVVRAISTTAADNLVVPIIGASGSGKSHLVLWIREMLRSDEDDRRIIYVPKSRTSLAGVIELILEGCEGGNYDKLREDVRTAATAMSERERALRLRNELVLQVAAFEGDPSHPSARARDYVKSRLPALLNDAIFEEKLLADGGALQRVVDDATRGGNEDVAEFVAEDLLVELSPLEQRDLGAQARQMLGRLENAQVRDAAVDLLNEVRDRAISAVFGVAPHQLLGVFEDLRREIQNDTPGQRLLLMIEDFTLLQGIQHDLLEAMIANARPSGGELELAPMTTVMAVTKGFLQRVFTASSGGDTVRTRIADQGHVYSLDSAYGQADGYDAALARTMVGKYLNATRLSVDGLTYPDTANACDACPHRDACHEGFGTSTDGFGLYPFNDLALDRMARSTNDDFNPRSMLSSLQKTLTHHGEELAEGAFPSEEWARLFDGRANGVNHPPPTLRLEVQREAEDTLKGEQRARLLTFWGGVPDRLGDLDPAIHQAFGIPPLGTAPVRPRPIDPAVVEVERPKSSRDLVGERVQAWRDGGRLGADDAREVRRFVGQAMLEAFDAETRLTSRRMVDRLFSRERDVVIDRSQYGSGASSGGAFQIHINSDREGIDLVEGILRAVDVRGVAAPDRVAAATWAYPGGADRLALLADVAAREAESFARHVEARSALERPDREALICALYLGGIMLGFGSLDGTEGKIAAVCAAAAPSVDGMPPKLRTLCTRLGQRRSDDQGLVFSLVELRQGTGATLGIDPSEVVDVVRTFEKTWNLPSVAPDGLAHPTLQLFDGVDEALDQARDVLREWHQQVTEMLGSGEDWAATSKAVRAVLADAVAYVRPAAAAPDAPTDSQIASAVREVEGVLSGWDSRASHENARALTGLPWARLEPARQELARLQKALTRAAESADASSSGSSQDNPIAEFGAGLQRYVSTMDALLDDA